VNAASAGVLTGDAELGEGGRTQNPGISTSDLIDDGLALLHKIHTQAHRSLHLNAKFRLRVRIVKCSDFKVEVRFADGSTCKVQVELHDFDGQVCAVIERNFWCVYIQYMCLGVGIHECISSCGVSSISWLLKSKGLFCKRALKKRERETILQKRSIILRSLLIVATPYTTLTSWCVLTLNVILKVCAYTKCVSHSAHTQNIFRVAQL